MLSDSAMCESTENDVRGHVPVIVRATDGTGGSGPTASAPGRRGRSGRRREEGQALVEFALVFPILMLIMLGILKFGILYNNYLQLTDAVRSGARQLAIERGQGDPCGDSATALIAAANLGTGLNVQITDANPADSSDIYTYAASSGPGSGSCPTLESGDAVTVSATYPCDLDFMGFHFFSGCTLTSSATERAE